MVATADVRFKRMKQEYLTLRDAQDELMGKVDTYEGTLLSLTQIVTENRQMIAENRDLIVVNREMIAENRQMIAGNRDLITENRELITENRDLIVENREMLRAIIEHLQVPYNKPPMGFRSD